MANYGLFGNSTNAGAVGGLLQNATVTPQQYNALQSQYIQPTYNPAYFNLPMAPPLQYPQVNGAQVTLPIESFNELTKQAYDAKKAREQFADRLTDALKRLESIQDNKPLPVSLIINVVREWARDGA